MASVLLFAAPLAAHAAGMGKITVLSALGQPLRAELDIVASREELGSLVARVAPVEAFRQANVEYASVLPSVRFVLDKRADGKPYFRIQTDRAVNDPFIDFLVELNWSSGRLVREYAFLLDPPELKADNAAAVVMAPVAPSSVDTTSPARESPEAEVESEQNKELHQVPVGLQKPKVENEVASPVEDATNTRKVKRGDTLGKIAAESATAGVTLNQMLVALFNNNRDAFIGGNMNRLRAGRILNIPEAETVAHVNAGEARKIVVVQYAAFNAYRNSLAASAANQTPVEQQTQQSSTGKIMPKVEEKTLSASGQDKLLVSSSEAHAKAGKGRLSEEDIIARDNALKEANSRISELEKNLADLKKLAELKSQTVANAQKTAQTASVAPVSVEAKPAPALAGSTVSEMPAVSVSAAVPAADKPQPKPKPKKKIILPPPLPEPSFVEDNPMLVYGGGAVLAAVFGFLGFQTWRRKRESAKDQAITASELATSSVFGIAASESVDNDLVATSDFSHSTIDAVDTEKEGVDPIQEAEVYMAYGRDGQAEDILVDAMQKDPDNFAVYLKLLEIYAGRKSLSQFNELASELNTRTGGIGQQWDEAAALGRSVDPANPLYDAGDVAPEPVQHGQDVIVESDPADETIVMSAPLLQEAPVSVATIEEELPSTLDFDLDLDEAGEQGASVAAPAAPATATLSDIDFDLDLGSDDKSDVDAEQSNDLDINFNAQTKTDNGLDFDFDLGTSEPDSLEQPAPPLDLSSINLDLNEPVAPAVTGSGSDSAEVATKLELAQAYEEMGDHEGARELLQEVLTEGSPAQQEAARNKLTQLG
ncbi:MAG: FimV/HubP family polar landmark protein [Georgfuchsia sp.]